MSQRVTCPGCGAVLRVPDSARGRPIRCGRCRQVVAADPQPAADPRALARTLPREPAGGAAAADERAVIDTRRDEGAAPPAARDTRAEDAPPAPAAPFRVRSPGEERGPPPLGRVGRFELRAALGQGTFGRVYRAYDPALDREVALKVPRHTADRPGAVERFVEEARAAARLRHPNVVAVFEVGQADGQWFIASELVDGLPLSARLAEGRPSFRRAAQWVRDLALALEYAHGQGIVHRDVKPANVLIDRHERAQLMDFGLATRADGDPNRPAEAGRVGTPAYMAPEEAGGRAHAGGPPGDQYSLGVVLYELLTGRLPYQGTAAVVMARAADPHRRPPPPRQVNPEVPPDLEAVCLTALAKQPLRRYPSAGEMAADLQRWLTGEPVRVRDLGRLERARLWYRRHRTRAVAGLLATGMLLAGAVLAAGFALYRRHQNDVLARQQAALAEAVRAGDEEAETLRAQQRREHERFLRAECRRYREGGLRRCEQHKPREGVLLLGEAFARAVEAGDEKLQRSVADDLAAWVPKLEPPVGTSPLPRALYERAARRLLGLPPGDQAPAAGEGDVVRLLGVALPDTAGTEIVAFRADGKTLVTGDGRALAVWDAASGRRQGPPRPVLAPATAAVSADGQAFVAEDARTGMLQVKDTVTGQPRGEPFAPNVGTVTAVFLSPDGKRVVVRGNKGWGRLFDGVSGKCLGPQSQYDWRFDTIVWNADGTVLADVGASGYQVTARVWDATTGKAVRQLALYRGERNDVRAIALSAGGKFLLVAAPGRTARMWDVQRGGPVGEQLQHPHAITCLALGPDGRTALIGGGPAAQLWEPAADRPPGPALPHPADVTAVTFSPDGKAVATCAGNAVRVWEAATGRPLGLPLEGTSAAVRALFGPDGSTVVAVHRDRVYLWPTPGAYAAPEARGEGVRLWLQVLTGRELGDGDEVRALDEPARKERRARFEHRIGLNGP
jgi:WD40 repeat protein